MNPLSSWEITRLRDEFPDLKTNNHPDAVNRSFSFSVESSSSESKQEAEASITHKARQTVNYDNTLMLMSMAHSE